MNRREFLEVLAAASAGGFPLAGHGATARAAAVAYDVPGFGNAHLLHFTDTHAQLLPTYFREPSVNLGLGDAAGRPPHLVGDAFLRYFGIAPGTRLAHAFTSRDFVAAARTYGRVGGFAHLATLIDRLKASRPSALLLDGGDSWQGSATALWTKGQDMVDASKLLGVDAMTGHWEFTLGAERVKEVVEGDFKGRVDFLAQNVRTADFGDPVFAPYVMREQNGVPIAIVGQAFPYTPIANPRYFVLDWSFGIREQELQQVVDEVRGKGAQVVVLLSHNGMDVDLKLASRVRGIDAILGGHTHDGVPRPSVVANAGGKTLVTNAGCNGKFLAVLDFDVKSGSVADFRYKLLPVFANLLPARGDMAALISRVRAPYEHRLQEKLAVTDNLFNPDPYYQQGGDMVRVGGLQYSCEPTAAMGSRISAMTLNGTPLSADKRYKVAGWAPVSEEARVAGGEPIWELMARYLRGQKTIRPRALNLPKLVGVDGNPGLAR